MAQISAEAAVHGINFSFVVATWMTLAALILAFFIRKVRPQEDAPAPRTEPGAASPAVEH